MLVPNQSTDNGKALGLPVHSSHPLNAWPLFHLQLGWVLSITTVPHPFREGGLGISDQDGIW